MKKQTLAIILAVLAVIVLLLIIFNLDLLFPLPDPTKLPGVVNG